MKIFRMALRAGMQALVAFLAVSGTALAASEDYRISSSKTLDPLEAAAFERVIASPRPLLAADIENFKQALRKHGWPTVSSLGLARVDALGRALLDAGADAVFQEDVLRAMDPQVSVDIDPLAYARLVDEIQIQNGEDQRYGTVLQIGAGDRVVAPKMPKKLSGLRFYRDFYGLESMDDQLARVQARVNSGEAITVANPFPSLSVVFAGYEIPDVRQELGRMIEADQRTRHALIAAKDEEEKAKLRAEVDRVDGANLSRIQEILDQFGFPNVAQVGRDGVSTFFLLVQHASDVQLQRRALDLAKPLMESRQLSRQQYALLTDRVRLAEGKKQLYGTQTDKVDGEIVLKPVEDIDHLDDRRAKMAMGSSKEYLDLIRARYQDK